MDLFNYIVNQIQQVEQQFMDNKKFNKQEKLNRKCEVSLMKKKYLKNE